MATKKKPAAAPAQEQLNLIIGDQSYPIAALPAEVQELVALYQRWGNEKVEAQIEVSKCDAAQRALATEIAARLKSIEAGQNIQGPTG